MFIECFPFSNVVNDGRATINFANLLGYTIEYILLELGTSGGVALTKAQMTALDIKANGKTILSDTGARTDSRMKYRGETASDSYLVLAFDESRARTEQRGFTAGGQPNVIDGEKIGAIDTTFGIQSLTGEVLIAGANAPTLKAYAEVSAAPIPDTRFRGLIAKTLNYTVSPAAAGTFPFEIPYGRQAGSIIKRIFLFGSTVTGYEVKKNGITIQKVASAALNAYIETREGRVPQSNIQCIDFIKDGNQSSALNAADAQTMEFYLTVSGSGNVTIVVELYDPLNNN